VARPARRALLASARLVELTHAGAKREDLRYEVQVLEQFLRNFKHEIEAKQ